MTSISCILSAITEFLNNVQSLGIIKEFSLEYCDDVNFAEISRTNTLLSDFLQKVNALSTPTKTSSSDEEYVIVEDEKVSESDIVESPTNEISEDLDSDKVSVRNTTPPAMEQMAQTENNSESNILSMDCEEKERNANLVQITVNTDEMKRRISAFISRKRKEVDEWNVQEFCGRSYIDEQDPAWDESNSCARIDAVFVPRRGCKSHIKVSRVQNGLGAQAQIKKEPIENNPTLDSIDERLGNMEVHLKLNSDKTLRTNIFQRIKKLEDRILLLESTSPEYRHMLNPESPPKKKRYSEEKVYSNCSLDDIQRRIQTLKNALKMKAASSI